jgi:hypothetical protein
MRMFKDSDWKAAEEAIRTAVSNTSINPFTKTWFLLQADELYSLTRFAYFAFLMNVTFRSAHNALEYYLKASLADRIPLPNLKRFGHDLTALYESFVKVYLITPVRMEVIKYIDHFDKMRYPIQSGTFRILWGAPFDEFFRDLDENLRKHTACFYIKDFDHIVHEIRERVVPLSDAPIIAVTPEHQSFLYRDNPYFKGP